MKTTDIKQSVKAFMQKNGKVAYGLTLIPLLVNMILSSLSGTIPFLFLITVPLTILLAVLIQVTFLALTRGESFSLDKHIFEHGKELGGSYIILTIVTSLYISLWYMLFCIPGIVKMFAYILAPYIQHDNPDLTANEVLAKSIRMTNGKKAHLFSLYLSYYGGVYLFFSVWVISAMNSLYAGFATGGAEASVMGFGLVAIVSLVAAMVCSVMAAPRWYAALAATYEACLNEE